MRIERVLEMEGERRRQGYRVVASRETRVPGLGKAASVVAAGGTVMECTGTFARHEAAPLRFDAQALAACRSGMVELRGGRRSALAALAEAVGGVGSPPCERGCGYVQSCAAGQTACKAFSDYVGLGRSSTRVVVREPDDLPSREVFGRLFRSGGRGGRPAGRTVEEPERG